MLQLSLTSKVQIWVEISRYSLFHRQRFKTTNNSTTWDLFSLSKLIDCRVGGSLAMTSLSPKFVVIGGFHEA